MTFLERIVDTVFSSASKVKDQLLAPKPPELPSRLGLDEQASVVGRVESHLRAVGPKAASTVGLQQAPDPEPDEGEGGGGPFNFGNIFNGIVERIRDFIAGIASLIGSLFPGPVDPAPSNPQYSFEDTRYVTVDTDDDGNATITVDYTSGRSEVVEHAASDGEFDLAIDGGILEVRGNASIGKITGSDKEEEVDLRGGSVDEVDLRGGNDELYVYDAAVDSARMGDGDDTLYNYGSLGVGYGGDGDDHMRNLGQGSAVGEFHGENGDDLILAIGGVGDDGAATVGLATGGEGDDIIFVGGRGRLDEARGGTGDDRIINDSVLGVGRGGEGDDQLINYGEVEEFSGGAGNDELFNGGADGDASNYDGVPQAGSFRGGSGNDRITIRAGQVDSSSGGEGTDGLSLFGGAGDYTIDGQRFTHDGQGVVTEADGTFESTTFLEGQFLDHTAFPAGLMAELEKIGTLAKPAQGFRDVVHEVFGYNVDNSVVNELEREFFLRRPQSGYPPDWPPFRLFADDGHEGDLGHYDAQSGELVVYDNGEPGAVERGYLEALGHYMDHRLHPDGGDARGDEGELFAEFIRRSSVSQFLFNGPEGGVDAVREDLDLAPLSGDQLPVSIQPDDPAERPRHHGWLNSLAGGSLRAATNWVQKFGEDLGQVATDVGGVLKDGTDVLIDALSDPSSLPSDLSHLAGHAEALLTDAFEPLKDLEDLTGEGEIFDALGKFDEWTKEEMRAADAFIDKRLIEPTDHFLGNVIGAATGLPPEEIESVLNGAAEGAVDFITGLGEAATDVATGILQNEVAPAHNASNMAHLAVALATDPHAVWDTLTGGDAGSPAERAGIVAGNIAGLFHGGEHQPDVDALTPAQKAARDADLLTETARGVSASIESREAKFTQGLAEKTPEEAELAHGDMQGELQDQAETYNSMGDVLRAKRAELDDMLTSGSLSGDDAQIVRDAHTKLDEHVKALEALEYENIHTGVRYFEKTQMANIAEKYNVVVTPYEKEGQLHFAVEPNAPYGEAVDIPQAEIKEEIEAALDCARRLRAGGDDLCGLPTGLGDRVHFSEEEDVQALINHADAVHDALEPGENTHQVVDPNPEAGVVHAPFEPSVPANLRGSEFVDAISTFASENPGEPILIDAEQILDSRIGTNDGTSAGNPWRLANYPDGTYQIREKTGQMMTATLEGGRVVKVEADVNPDLVRSSQRNDGDELNAYRLSNPLLRVDKGVDVGQPINFAADDVGHMLRSRLGFSAHPFNVFSQDAGFNEVAQPGTWKHWENGIEADVLEHGGKITIESQYTGEGTRPSSLDVTYDSNAPGTAPTSQSIDNPILSDATIGLRGQKRGNAHLLSEEDIAAIREDGQSSTYEERDPKKIKGETVPATTSNTSLEEMQDVRFSLGLMLSDAGLDGAVTIKERNNEYYLVVDSKLPRVDLVDGENPLLTFSSANGLPIVFQDAIFERGTSLREGQAAFQGKYDGYVQEGSVMDQAPPVSTERDFGGRPRRRAA